MTIRTGILNLGPNGKIGAQRVSFDFATPFAKQPKVFITPFTDDPNATEETFGVTVVGITLAGCSFNISRVDLTTKGGPAGTGYSQGVGWDIDLQVQWLAIDD